MKKFFQVTMFAWNQSECKNDKEHTSEASDRLGQVLREFEGISIAFRLKSNK